MNDTGSPTTKNRLLAWLEEHTAFGPMIRDWRRGCVVRRRAKWIATGVMSASGIYLLLSSLPRWAAGLAISCMTVVAVWLWRRPERFSNEAHPDDTQA